MHYKKIGLAIFFCLITPYWVFANETELRLKTVFLGRFAEYVSTPSHLEGKNYYQIGVLGNNIFGEQLDVFYKDKKIKNMPVKIEYFDGLEDVVETDLLFVNLPVAAARKNAIDFAKQKSILTISDVRGFAEQGGIIQINFVEQKASIIVNYQAAVESGLFIKAPLLSIATVVQGGKP